MSAGISGLGHDADDSQRAKWRGEMSVRERHSVLDVITTMTGIRNQMSQQVYSAGRSFWHVHRALVLTGHLF